MQYIMEEKELVEQNIKLVRYLASMKMGRNVNIDDLIQEGCIGLINAAEKFDVTKDCKFFTYAYFWIKKAIITAIYNQSTIVRLPVHFWEKFFKLMNVKNELAIKLNREPTIEEIARVINISVPKVNNVFNYYKRSLVFSLNSDINYSDVDLKYFHHLARQYLIECECFEEVDNISLENFISSEEKSLEDVVLDKLEKDYLYLKVKQLFADCNLTEQEVSILRLRYGFYGEPKTLKEISKIYGTSKRAISEIELCALEKMRKSNYISSKKVFCDIFYVNDNEKDSNETVNSLEQEGKSKFKINIKKIYFLKRYIIIKKTKYRTIYHYFSEYTKEEINTVLNQLNEEDSYLLLLRYGGNLENPIQNYNLTNVQMNQFYNRLIPKIQKQLIINKKIY